MQPAAANPNSDDGGMRRKRFLIVWVPLAACTPTIASRSSAPPLGGWCAPASDDVAEFMRNRLAMIASASDEDGARYRREVLDDMPHVAASEVQLVSDPTVCERASAAFDAAIFKEKPARPSVYVVRMGPRYGILPKTGSALGVYHTILFADSSFRPVVKALF